MEGKQSEAVAVVGVGAILPDAPDAKTFWTNVRNGRYSISEVQPSRWDPELYHDPDPAAPDKTYSKIGGWVRDWTWDPMAWKLPIPPKVAEAMDDGQKWAVACTKQALDDYGYPERPLDRERTAVILGNAMAGERHYFTTMRILAPELYELVRKAPTFISLSPTDQEAFLEELRHNVAGRFPSITEDTMPGELGNVLAGRVANLFDFRGPNFITDAACASAMAAMNSAYEGLIEGDFDAVISGGIDRNMGIQAFVKFSKIGALSATGTRPYAHGADGFVMGEGAAVFLLKRLADAERAGDRIYAVIRSLAGSSDGRGKGITAPNPVGQKLAVERAWKRAGAAPDAATLIEGHGTSTRVGDAAEVESLTRAFASFDLPARSIPLGSVKSNIGHLKAAAGAAGMLKAIFALSEQELPPSLNCSTPNPGIDFAHSPFQVNTEARPWSVPTGTVRRAGVSAFGFGGTNFHAVLEEYRPGAFDERVTVSVPEVAKASTNGHPAPLRGALVVGGETAEAIARHLTEIKARANAGDPPAVESPSAADLSAPERVAIDFADAAELSHKIDAALKALRAGNAGIWKAVKARGIFHGSGPAPKVAFLYTGQGSQYVNMLAELRRIEPIVAEVFDEADRIMTPLLGRPLSDCIFVDPADQAAVAKADADLMQTAITQPAVLAADAALTKLLAAYGIEPDMVMGHSLGEYGALVAAEALPFDSALEAVSARGREMTKVSMADNGAMAAVFAPMAEVERILAGIDGYAVVANINSNNQAVVGGATDAVLRAIAAFMEAGYQAIQLPVSHAFHTSIVAPASEPLKQALRRLRLTSPERPIVANVDGEFYPTGDVVEEMLAILARQVASPVQFVKGLRTLYDAGARVFIETGPKKALAGFVDDVLGQHDDVVSLFTNHPKVGDIASFNQALCGLYAAGLGTPEGGVPSDRVASRVETPTEPRTTSTTEAPRGVAMKTEETTGTNGTGHRPHIAASAHDDTDGDALAIGRLFVDFLERSRALHEARHHSEPPRHGPYETNVVITGAALGLPGTERVFDDGHVGRILAGEQLIGPIPDHLRAAMLEKHVTRLVKRDNGDPSFETIDSLDDVIKLAGRAGALDIEAEFGVEHDRVPALDRSTKLAIGAGIDAMRDGAVPLVMRYRTTHKGTKLPERWVLPAALQDETGVIFASAFPAYDSFAGDLEHFHTDRTRREDLAALTEARANIAAANGQRASAEALDKLIADLQATIAADPYEFDRRFLFKALSMGHSQFAELIGARGPNAQINSACASTTQAIALAEDWIRAGRCRRVVVVAADDATSDKLMGWIGAGFLASGAAATDEAAEDAATPFDRRRHGMIIGMGAAALVVESEEAARERGIRPICDVLGTVTANSAFHGSRLDVDHITSVMERLVREAETRWHLTRAEIAPQLVFVSHETYTPARGGSAAAEVEALRTVFGPGADGIVVANTKGFTGHPMGVGIEDVVAVKSLETGIVPPVPNFREVDPELGELNLSKGGSYPIRYAVRLAAGFGSQISMSLLRWSGSPDGARRRPDELGFEYRIEDRDAWTRWLASLGDESPELEVVQRQLRIKDRRVVAPAPEPAEPPMASTPADGSEDGSMTSNHPEELAAGTPPEPAVSTGAEAEPTDEAATTTDIEAAVLALVADKTGYPQDMLDLDLDLEADLGVDTVKQAEIFATVRETYAIPRNETLKLRDFPTLQHVIGFVVDRAPAMTRGPAPAAVGRDAIEPAEVEAPDMAGGPATPRPVDEPAVRDRVLALVAEKTGYPEDMLDLDLDLEADLGVDTVKQAEIFATIRESYGIPREETLKLRDFPTLQHVIGFVVDRIPGAEPRPQVEETIQAIAEEIVETTPRPQPVSFEAANAVPRRVPIPVLRPPLDICKPTGVSIDETSRVVVMADDGGVSDALAERLRARGATALVQRGAPDAGELTATIAGWLEDGPIDGVYWLPALDTEPAVSDLDLASWREGLRRRVKLLYATIRALGEPKPFLVSATRMGGLHGYGEAGASNPMGGAVAGFTKAYAREADGATVKVIDAPTDASPSDVADTLVEETLRDPGAVEIGRTDGARWTIGLEERPAADGAAGMALGPETVFVVTGAAGSIVSAIVADLATASGGTFHLLDLAPPPNPHDAEIAAFQADRDGLKRTLFERLKSRGERPTPAMIGRELAGLERRAAALTAIRTVEASGGEAMYHQLDLTDGDAVAKVVEEIRQRHGRIDVVLHAAGVEISHLLADKEPREYDLVFDVKSDGWFNLLHAIGEMPVGATVAFSSVAGRFGNGGQTDYSAANDLLCTTTSSLRRTRPATRGIAIDWTAWGEIGMATRGSIPKMMELAGIDMLPPEAGIPVIRRELTAGGFRGEVVIGNRLGALVDETDPSRAIDVDRIAPEGPMVGTISAGIFRPFEVRVTLDPAEQPFLHDHRIDGTPVLPGVMGIEAFAEAASAALPGWHVAAVEDVEFLAPFKFYRGRPRTLAVRMRFGLDGDGIVAKCELVGERKLPNQPEPQFTTHFTGSVRMTRVAAESIQRRDAVPITGRTVNAEDIYRVYFHGPAYRVLDHVDVDVDRAEGAFGVGLPIDHSAATGEPLAMPRLVELAFQTAGVWEIAQRRRFALPRSVARVAVLARPRGDVGLSAVITAIDRGASFDAVVVDRDGTVCVRLEGYRTVELPGALDPNALEAAGAAV